MRKGLRLYIISRVLCLLLTPYGFYYACRKAIKEKGWKEGCKVIGEKLEKMAVGRDIYGGVVCAEWFNDELITPEAPLKFGDQWITISEVIGVNQRHRELRLKGKRLKNLLSVIEPGHTRKAAADN